MNKRHPTSGFSLVELLLAIFILGIGIIAVAAIFPAGIAQQQRTRDDVIGPIVAAQALNLLRTKLSQEDFGTFEQFDLTADLIRNPASVGSDNVFTVSGDWGWMRPSFLLEGPGIPGIRPARNFDPDPLAGAIDIFGLRHTRSQLGAAPHPATASEPSEPSGLFYTSDFAEMGTDGTKFFNGTYGSIGGTNGYSYDNYIESDPSEISKTIDPNLLSDFSNNEGRILGGIPFNRNKYLICEDFLPSGANPNDFDDHTDVLRDGRSEPLFTLTQRDRSWPIGAEKPEFYWDCMFRRFQGRIQVAVFVYRVNSKGGEQLPYTVSHHSAPSDVELDLQLANPRESPLPVRYDITDPDSRWYPWGAPVQDDDPLNNLTVPETLPSGSGLIQLDPYVSGWQQAGQWLIDQNGTVHRVLAGRDNKADGPVRLINQVPFIPVMDVNGNLNNNSTVNGVNPLDLLNKASAVKTIWFIPPETRNGFTLIPVYATVGEL